MDVMKDYWLVLYTKSRNEKKVAEQLNTLGMRVYCPMVKEVHQWSDRKKIIEKPLIPSYVFIQISEQERDKVFQVSGVVRYLFWLGEPAKVRNSEIDVLKGCLNTDNHKFNVENLQVGDRFSMPDGQFKGQEGLVSEVNHNRLQLVLKELGLKITFSKKGERN